MVSLLKYWRPIACLLIAVLLVGGIFAYGRNRYQAGYYDATAKITADLAAAAKRQEAQAREASKDFQTAKAEREQKERVRYVTVQKIVERPVYINDCIDDDGLHQLNAAIADGQPAAR